MPTGGEGYVGVGELLCFLKLHFNRKQSAFLRKRRKMKRNIYILALLGAIGLGAVNLAGCRAHGDEFVMRAEISEITEGEILVSVIEAPHGNSGPFTVLVSSDTPVRSSQGAKISLSDLAVGEVIEITYGGQVMMSYPPKIAAREIVRC